MKVYDIPSAWLMGAVQARERQGLTLLEALTAAVAAWDEQARLATWESSLRALLKRVEG